MSATVQVIRKLWDGIEQDIVQELYDSGHIVEYRKPQPCIRLAVDRTRIIANGVDTAMIVVTFYDPWAEQAVIPTGNVTFDVNLRPTTVAVDPTGTAVLSVSATAAGTYQVTAAMPGYGQAQAIIEALP